LIGRRRRHIAGGARRIVGADQRELGSASVRLPAAGFLNLIFDDKAPQSLLDEFAAYRDV
jgi:hypothetical protein